MISGVNMLLDAQTRNEFYKVAKETPSTSFVTVTALTVARFKETLAQNITVMTNGLNIAWELANAAGITVLLTGGLLRQQSLSLQGSQAEASLNSYSFDTLFLGVDGLDLLLKGQEALRLGGGDRLDRPCHALRPLAGG